MVKLRHGVAMKSVGMSKETAEKRGFIGRLFIPVPFPTQKSRELKDGKFELSHHNYLFKAEGMVPRGIGARLLIVSLSTHLARQKKLQIPVRDLLLISPSRRSRESMKKAIERFSNTTFLWERRGGKPLSDIRFEIKYKRFIVQESFFDEVTSRPVPIDLNVVERLRGSALALDLYFWLVYKTYYQRSKITIPWKDLKQQFGQSYANDSSGRQWFEKSIRVHFRKIYLLCEYPMLSIDGQGINFKFPGSKL